MGAIQLFSNISIRAKLYALSGFLLVVLLSTNIYGSTSLSNLKHNMENAENDISSMVEKAGDVNKNVESLESVFISLDIANSALREFGEMKYWLSDLSASWQSESESGAENAKKNLEEILVEIAKFAPDEAKQVKQNTNIVFDLGIQAVDAYAGDNRVQGNSLLSKARVEIIKSDKILVSIVDDLKAKALSAKNDAKKSATESLQVGKSSIDNAEASIHSADITISTAITVLIIAFVTSVALTLFLVRSLINPIRSIVKIMEEQANDNFSSKLPPATKNEIGEMVKGLEIWRDRAAEAKMMQDDQERQQKDKIASSEKLAELTDKFDSNITVFVSQLTTATENLQATSGSLSSVAERGKSQSSTLASATDSASNNVNTVASAAEELSSSIKEINQQISRSSNIAKTAVEKADKANNVIDGLLESSEQIGQVSDMINDIAEQINLLALNATIEAARAGESGKGFAVVASEVKNLATQTASATAKIAEHISTTQEQTKNTAGALQEIGKTINEINEISTSISAAMEEQGAATQEIARSIQQAAQSTSEATTTVKEVSEASEETNVAASELTKVSGDLSEKSSTLRNEVETFLANIKAA